MYTLEEIKQIGATPKKKIAHKLGFFYRLFTPYISYLIINYTKIGPNTISLLALLTPIFASILFLFSKPYILLLGSILHQIGYFFDVLDGEIARIRKKDNIQGTYIDSLNHYFNIPFLFVGLAFGAYLHSGKISLIIAAFLLSFFSRGTGKYCMFYAIGKKKENLKMKLEFTNMETDSKVLEFPKNKTKFDEFIVILKSIWVYPNITVLILLASLFNLIQHDFFIFSIKTNIIECLIYFYAGTIEPKILRY